MTGLSVAADDAETVFDSAVADLIGDDIAVDDNAITGTVKYYDTESQLVTAFGAGNFLPLKFTLPEDLEPADVKVGLVPSEGSGLVPLDSDLDAVFYITDKDAQILRVQTTINGVDYSENFDLSGLTLEEE